MMATKAERRKGTMIGAAAFIPATTTTKAAVVTRERPMVERFPPPFITPYCRREALPLASRFSGAGGKAEGDGYTVRREKR